MPLYNIRQIVILCLLLCVLFFASVIKSAGRDNRTAGPAKTFVYNVQGGRGAQPGFYCFREQKTLKQLAEASGATFTGAVHRDTSVEAPLRNGSAVVFGDRVHIGQISAQARIVFYLPLPVHTASAEDLTCIPGIGKHTADQIVLFRNTRGGIQDIDDLLQVKGIGKRRLETLKRYISID